jgi:2-phospho-L-lactate transferase/gluconeogenesis factor (CofD/UPF0052 family)
MTQPGETDGFDGQKHLATVKQYAPQIEFDYVLLNDRPISSGQATLYAADGAFQVTWGETRASANGTGGSELVRANVLEEGEMVRHDPDQLARVVLACGAKSLVPMPVMV